MVQLSVSCKVSGVSH